MFDTLHALGITMCQKWAYDGIEQLLARIHKALCDDIANYPWFGTHNNINIPFRVYEQRLSNQSHFDCGTVATIFVIKDLIAICPSNHTFQQQQSVGAQNPITYKDVIKLEFSASARIRVHAVYKVLSFLTDIPAFSFETYDTNYHDAFKPPTPVTNSPWAKIT